MKKVSVRLLMAVLLVAVLLTGCCAPTPGQRAIKALKVGSEWPDAVCKWTTLVESNQQWDKYRYTYDATIFFTVDKQGTVIGLYRP